MRQKWQMIKDECIRQSRTFIHWHETKKYAQFHHSHYDWWTFPYDKPSTYRDKYQIGPIQRTHLIGDKDFISALRTNAILVCIAWGFDLEKGVALPQESRTTDQHWQKWPIRLFKMSCSLQLFQQDDLHKNSVKYALSLIHKGERFIFNGRSLEQYYRKNEKDTGSFDDL